MNTTAVEQPFTYAHGTAIHFPVKGSHDISLANLITFLPEQGIPVYTKRNIQYWDRNKTIIDFASIWPVCHIGNFTATHFVKDNNNWVLHGIINYFGKEELNNKLIRSMTLNTMYINHDRNNPSSELVLAGFSHIDTHLNIR